jgi:DNA-binding transcriptional regulator YdaS (Cro superfamily)
MSKEPVITEVFKKAGGRKAVQEALGLSKQSLSDWRRNGVVPVRHCPLISRLTGVELERLNPAFRMPKPKRG